MPGFDRMDVVEEIDRRSPDSVVMISGYPSVGRAAEAMKRGAMDYVTKPVTHDEITDTVKKAVKNKTIDGFRGQIMHWFWRFTSEESDFQPGN